MSTAEKSGKYDRQIRVWGKHGQDALFSARVCVLSCHPALLECVKNLALAGIKSITIVDNAKITADDKKYNYFVGNNHKETLCGAAAVRTLSAMNSEVTVDWLNEDPEEYGLALTGGFDLVLYEALSPLEAVLGTGTRSMVSIAVETAGLFGYIRPFARHHVVLEPNEERPASLHLSTVWPELEEYLASFSLDRDDEAAYIHTPAVVFLYQVLTEFTAKHGRAPGYGDRKECVSMVERYYVKFNEMNIDEAKSMVNTQLLAPAPAPPAVLSDPIVAGLVHSAHTFIVHPHNKRESLFWLFAAALRVFIERHGHLPVSSRIPDMTCSTEAFVKLQAIYTAKAKADCHELRDTMLKVATGCPEQQTVQTVVDDVDDSVLALLTRNAADIALVSFPPAIHTRLDDMPTVVSDMPAVGQVAVMFSAARRFIDAHGRVPVSDADIQPLQAIIDEMLTPAAFGTDTAFRPPLTMVTSFARSGFSAMGATCAFIGGIAAQEAVKLLTGQFIPISGELMHYGAPGDVVCGVIGKSCV